jgi:hypothetical protein
MVGTRFGNQAVHVSILQAKGFCSLRAIGKQLLPGMFIEVAPDRVGKDVVGTALLRLRKSPGREMSCKAAMSP